MKIVICWSHISGYMAACWRALAAIPDVELFVLAYKSHGVAPFDEGLMAGIHHRLLDEQQRLDEPLVEQTVAERKPDIVLMGGWINAAYKKLVTAKRLRGCQWIIGMDTPFRNDWRQWGGRIVLKRFLSHFDCVLVPGERAWRYASYLGFPESRIRKGLYAIDYDAFSPCYQQRLEQPGGWPRKFMYVGRYQEQKAIDVLVEGYRRYRQRASDPWDLVCCGLGDDGVLFKNQPGITDMGFVSPADQRGVYSGVGAFVLPSRYDPWPLVIVEAAAAGLPVICSSACGSAVEVVRDRYSGFICGTEDPDALADSLARMHTANPAEFGARGQLLAEPYAAKYWPMRALDLK